mmetsp:Transcript_127635/g.226147  ORF Transcript_127635/g.226147 Transcript_127635/m.226147 type:complete len:90 (-) Transcript_127635:1579-1848(-)
MATTYMANVEQQAQAHARDVLREANWCLVPIYAGSLKSFEVGAHSQGSDKKIIIIIMMHYWQKTTANNKTVMTATRMNKTPKFHSTARA